MAINFLSTEETSCLTRDKEYIMTYSAEQLFVQATYYLW